MYQFFVEPSQIQGDKVVITGKDVNHIKNVLRMKPGEEISVKNGSEDKEYRCGIEELGEEEIICELRFIKEEGVELPSKIYLFQGLPKGDKMELILQKAVELGVYEVIPVASKRAVVKLDEKKAKSKAQRWQGIAQAAAKQSKRGIVPRIHEVMSFGEAAQYSRCAQVRLVRAGGRDGKDEGADRRSAAGRGRGGFYRAGGRLCPGGDPGGTWGGAGSHYPWKKDTAHRDGRDGSPGYPDVPFGAMIIY